LIEGLSFNTMFGHGQIPFADPAWYTMPRGSTPYFDESHERVRKAMREWVEEHIEPFVDEWDDPNVIRMPNDLAKKAFAAGWLQSCVWGSQALFPHQTWIGGVVAEDWTALHSLVVLGER
jgi:alkylation response protein AidB-like acyl-CoA dehydrogenase